ncbi:MAG: hypothetical protein AB7S65_13260 [Sulfuricurvum sp.]
MKLVKMSLAAAVLLGASAFAIDNVKVNGDAKLYYGTSDRGNAELFDKASSAADIAVRAGVTGDLAKNISFGLTGYAVTTLGLENNLVNSTWTGAHGARFTGAGYPEVDDKSWLGEAWIAATAGKTTAKLGRMELDTPFAFSEKWSVVPNTFEAAVVLNQDIPDTTLVGAWVGKGNGTNAVGGIGGGTNNTSTLAGASLALDGGVVGANAQFVTFGHNGAYAAAIVNNSFKPLVAQAWYYNVDSVADAYWLQADWDCQLVKGVKLGAQYAEMSPKGIIATLNDSKAYAVKAAYTNIPGLNVSVAYSKADEDGQLKIANVGTNNLGGAQSKLYTEAYWEYGYVGAPGAKSWNVTAEYDMKDIAKFGAYYTDVTIDNTNALNRSLGGYDNAEMNEVALTASKSMGPVDATLAYVNTEINSGDRFNKILAMFQLNF